MTAALIILAALAAYAVGAVLDVVACAIEEARWIKATARRHSRAPNV